VSTGKVDCKNGVFGDPISGVTKECYYQQPILPKPAPIAANVASTAANAVNKVASNLGLNVSASASVGGAKVTGSLTTSTSTTTSTNSNSASTLAKVASATTVVPQTTITTTKTAEASAPTWIYCSKENGDCSFTGKRNVRFGRNDKWNYKEFNGPVACDIKTFGDPITGTTKECWYWSVPVVTPTPSTTAKPTSAPMNAVAPLNAAASTATTTTTLKWVKCANEGQKCNFTGSSQVRYGVGNLWKILTITNGTNCDTKSFGSDPAVGKTKECWYQR